jgi:hypothetical protein
LRISLRFRLLAGFSDVLAKKLPGQGISNSDKDQRMKTVPLLISFVLAAYQFAEAQQSKKSIHRISLGVRSHDNERELGS